MIRHLIFPSLAAAAALVLPAAAAAQATPASAPDSEWITVTGPVSQISADGFVIDYGDGAIPVEMDGFASASATPLRAGDWVTVSGRIDDGLFERRSIEAASVYSSRMQERLWSSALDEEGDLYRFALIDLPDEGEWVGITGTVTRVDEAQNELIVDAGAMTIQVDTDNLPVPALANAGDRVSVAGRLDDADLWDSREIDARSVVILRQG